MKKIICIIGIVFFYILISNVSAKIIPVEALRVRVIPNSNSEDDVFLKEEVSDLMQEELFTLLSDIKNIEDAEFEIINNLVILEEEIQKLLNINNSKMKFKVNYGLNYFPKKEYKGIMYDEGYYPSLVVTLGEGQGDNWWCMLYPPICLIEDNKNDVYYTTFIGDLIKKYVK